MTTSLFFKSITSYQHFFFSLFFSVLSASDIFLWLDLLRQLVQHVLCHGRTAVGNRIHNLKRHQKHRNPNQRKKKRTFSAWKLRAQFVSLKEDYSANTVCNHRQFVHIQNVVFSHGLNQRRKYKNKNNNTKSYSDWRHNSAIVAVGDALKNRLDLFFLFVVCSHSWRRNQTVLNRNRSFVFSSEIRRIVAIDQKNVLCPQSNKRNLKTRKQKKSNFQFKQTTHITQQSVVQICCFFFGYSDFGHVGKMIIAQFALSAFRRKQIPQIFKHGQNVLFPVSSSNFLPRWFQTRNRHRFQSYKNN